tara:strand:+ start:4893 stop:5747 length:855 start_codon:yes stop_codon:yes gene_type:complete
VNEIKPRPKIQDYTKAITPLWKQDTGQVKLELEQSPYSIFVATPVHSEVSIHYTQSLLEFQKACLYKKIPVVFQLMKSSLVTQGRNLCVSAFLESKATHLLFIDSDIDFSPESIFKMLELDKDVISVPYPLKTMMWDKAFENFEKGKIKSAQDLSLSLNAYPMKLLDTHNIQVVNGVIEVTHSPTGCMLIKRSVFTKLIQKYPEKEIVQNTIINGKAVLKPNMWNFFDCLHDPETKTYLGEDYAFCKLWRDMGGQCYAYVLDTISHIGEHQYTGRFMDELIIDK